MQITSINNTQNFKSLNTSRLCSMDMKKIEPQIHKLEGLSRNYDIELISSCESVYNLDCIDIVVTPLKETLCLYTKLFTPKAKSMYLLNNQQDESIVEKVEEAISNLESKSKLRKLIEAFE